MTLFSASIMTVVDGALLQRRASFFTGGFLSDDHLRGPGEIAAFLAVSLVGDAAVIGMLAGLVMWVCWRLRLGRWASALAGTLAGVGPLIAANVLTYQLLRYLGEALDVSLAFDLAGQRVSEVIAVASAHVVTPIVVLATAGAIGGGLVWYVNRRLPSAPPAPPRLAALVLPLALIVIIGLVTTALATTLSDNLQNGVLRKPAGKVLAFFVDEVSDFDRDGFGIAGRLSDPDPRNATVFPFATDWPGNGVDENGVAGDLPVSVARYVEPPPPSGAWARRPDVILFVLETFRADLRGAAHLGRSVTPVLDALAARGVSSNAAYSPNGYTSQSRYHIFSGSLAGLRGSATLIDDFKANGYCVGYFSAQDESFGADRYDIGFARADVSYDARVDQHRRYSTFTTPGSLAVPLTVLQERIEEFLQRRQGDSRPLFLYVNFHDTHFPYTHESVQTLVSPERIARGAIVPGRRDALWATYVNTAANVDRAVGEVIDRVRGALGREPGVIVTADHGESLFEDGFLGHGHALNDIQTRVPLVVANLPMAIREPHSHVDLRDAIHGALQEDGEGKPVLVSSPGREIFQYLGTIDRPRQIGFLRASGRIIYDFRSRRLQTETGVWLRPTEANDRDRADFDRLVRFWESVKLARSQWP